MRTTVGARRHEGTVAVAILEMGNEDKCPIWVGEHRAHEGKVVSFVLITSHFHIKLWE